MTARRNFTDKVHATTYEFISPLHHDLQGRHVLITGAAWEDGVGHATSIAFARAGASVIAMADCHGVSDDLITKVETAALNADRPRPTVVAYTVDISDLQSVKTMTQAFERDYGRLDILVNNAAHQEPYLTILESDPEVDWRTWEVNVHGLVNMTRSLLPLMISSKDSKAGLCTIINVASSGALTARAGSSNYRSSKLAILRWTEILQLDHQAKGLLAYCVNPGAIKTRMTINESEEMRAKLPHKPDIAGDTITWLGAERKEWLAGRYISCPWDMEELVSRKDEIVQGDKLKTALAM